MVILKNTESPSVKMAKVGALVVLFVLVSFAPWAKSPSMAPAPAFKSEFRR
jgi:hypothetical protein